MKRGKKIVVVAHCYLNQNARVQPYASRQGVFKELINPLIEHGFGLIQLPCPESTACGLNMWEAVTEQYDNPAFRRHCRTILQPFVDQFVNHQKAGDRIYAVLGVPFSPCCGTKHNPSNKNWGGPLLSGRVVPELKIVDGPAVFMQELISLCEEASIKISFMDISETEDIFPELQPQNVLKQILEE